jgi:hypothetical protein
VCSALIAIDSEGERLKQFKEPEIRAALVHELRRLGETGRHLRKVLTDCWAADAPASTQKFPAFTIKQLATLLRCDERTVRRKIKNGALPQVGRVSTAYQIDPVVLRLFEQAGGFGRDEDSADAGSKN